MDRHFTVSIFIVCKDRVLLHLHKKSKKILPLGGHIEINELPEEACIRESKALKWYSKDDLNSSINIQPNILTMANEALMLLGEK